MDYKEKLKLAGDWYNDQSTTNKEKLLLEILFPELAESEEYVTHWEKGDKNSRFWRCQTIDTITEIEEKLNKIKLLIVNSKL